MLHARISNWVIFCLSFVRFLSRTKFNYLDLGAVLSQLCLKQDITNVACWASWFIIFLRGKKKHEDSEGEQHKRALDLQLNVYWRKSSHTWTSSACVNRLSDWSRCAKFYTARTVEKGRTRALVFVPSLVMYVSNSALRDQLCNTNMPNFIHLVGYLRRVTVAQLITKPRNVSKWYKQPISTKYQNINVTCTRYLEMRIVYL